MGQRRHYLLHVEDEEDIRVIVELSIALDGAIALRSFADARAALANLESMGEQIPDAFLLDDVMPGMTGKEMMAHLRTMPRFAATPVIFMTTSISEAQKAELLRLGATAIIDKPFNPLSLAREIRALLD